MQLVLFTPLATEDLQQIWLHPHLEADSDTADRFVDQIEQKCHKITLAPTGYRERPEFLSDIRSFPFKSYIIFYKPVEGGIEVFRIIHADRDLDQIFNE